MVAAVTRPTRSPVNGPGPRPATIARQVGRPGAGVGEHRVDLRGEQLTVRPGVDRAPLRARRDAVRRDLDQRRGHRGRRGVHHQYEHGVPA